jgi:hypothetical protein
VEFTEKLNLFLELFQGRPDAHARRWSDVGLDGQSSASGYAPVLGSLDAAAIGRHLTGEESLALLPGATTRLLTLDFGEQERALEFIETQLLPFYLERTRQGYRAWLFFEQPVSTALVERLRQRWNPSTLALEAVPLPRADFLDPETGESADDPWDLLANIQRVDGNLVQALAAAADEAGWMPTPSMNLPAGERVLRIGMREHLEFDAEACPENLVTFLESRLKFGSVRCGGRVGQRWVAPLGFWEPLRDFLFRARIDHYVEDLRTQGSPEPWHQSVTLSTQQQYHLGHVLRAEQALLQTEEALEVGLAAAAAWGVTTLIVVPDRARQAEWTRRLPELDLSLGRALAVTTLPGLARRKLAPLAELYACVVVDDVQRVPARLFCRVLGQLKPRYLLGLSVPPPREDGLERLFELYLGTSMGVLPPTPVPTVRPARPRRARAETRGQLQLDL